MLYLLAGYTGLRAAALLALTPESFTWADGKPTAVYSSACMQKNRGDHAVHLAPPIRPAVGEWLTGRRPGRPVFATNAFPRTAEMLRHDLAAARDAWIAEGKSEAERERRAASDTLAHTDASGRVFDFHSLRMQTAFILFKHGATLPEVQQVLDHSTPVLTANVYARLGGHLADTMARMPAPPAGSLGPKLGPEGGKTRRNEPPKVNGRPPNKKTKTRKS
jgi:integrase